MSRPSATCRPVDAPGARPRPRVHFTADDGWINDPYGIVWTGDRYHLFYQAIPGRVTWAPDCVWGHAESPDLLHWSECAPALVPQPFELGCWSGSAVMDGDRLRLFYTRITGTDWAHGSVALADGGPDSWRAGPSDVVVPGPPDRLGVTTFRDPFVFRHADEWVMIVGAGLDDGSAAAVQYRSPDLLRWTCDGLLASRRSTPVDDVWTGAVWECPQLFPLDDSWVLLVSVWDDDVLHYVAAALGDYDGRRFVPRTWQRLTYGSCAYAMSAFTDRYGRRCVLSWLREEPQNDPNLLARAGAHSVAAVLSRTDGGRLAVAPHPDVAAAFGPAQTRSAVDTAVTRIAAAASAVELVFVPAPGMSIRITNTSSELAVLAFSATAPELCVTRPGRTDERVPISSGRELRLLFDADLIEVFGARGYGAFRIDVPTDPQATEIVLSTPHPDVILRTV
jgi:beta-fructofuranosidase